MKHFEKLVNMEKNLKILHRNRTAASFENPEGKTIRIQFSLGPVT